jgi:hypothetical protein
VVKCQEKKIDTWRALIRSPLGRGLGNATDPTAEIIKKEEQEKKEKKKKEKEKEKEKERRKKKEINKKEKKNGKPS